MESKGKVFLRWFVGIGLFLTLLGGCGFVTNLWWQSLGLVAQQAILALAGVGIVYYCVLPVVGIIFMLGLYFLALYLTGNL